MPLITNEELANRASGIIGEMNADAQIITTRMLQHVMATYINPGLSQQDVIDNLTALELVVAVTLARTTETKSLYEAFCRNVAYNILKVRGERWTCRYQFFGDRK